MLRIASGIVLIILISAGLFWTLPEGQAQNRLGAAEYDFHSLALASVLESAAEASKLPDIPQRVHLLIQAVKVLPPSQHDEAVRLLGVALRDVSEWDSAKKVSWYQRHTAAALRNELLVVYVRVDPEKAMILQREFQAETKSSSAGSSATSVKSDWFTQFSDRLTIADQGARIALSLVDSDPEKALRLVVQSLQGGSVSGALFEIVQKLTQNGNRAFLNKLEIGMAHALGAQVTLDPTSIAFGSTLVLADSDMPSVARNGFVGFLMRSVQAQATLIRDSGGSVGIDPIYIRTVFIMSSLNVRPIILRYSPEQAPVFEQIMEQVAQFVPAETRSKLQAFQPETFSDPRDRLNDILKDQAPEKRDLRLVGLVSELLRNESPDFQKNLDVAADAISGFSDPDAKSAYTDLLAITRIDVLVKQKKFIEAQHLAGTISSEETRAWAMLALSTVAAKTDSVVGFELISNALRALEKASPSPHKVELALLATAMLAKHDPQRAFDTFSISSRYANSSASGVDPGTKPPFAFGLEATIGEVRTRLGVFPESLGELEVNPSFGVLGTTDWFRADQIVSDIREPSLRLKLKLQLAGAVLAQKSKPKRKETAPKQSVKN